MPLSHNTRFRFHHGNETRYRIVTIIGAGFTTAAEPRHRFHHNFLGAVLFYDDHRLEAREIHGQRMLGGEYNT